MRHRPGVSAETVHRAGLKGDALLRRAALEELLDELNNLSLVRTLDITDGSPGVRRTDGHERADPDELLEHGTLERVVVEDVALHRAGGQPGLEGGRVLAVGGGETLGVNVGNAVRGLLAELGDGEVDESLGVGPESPSIEPWLQHAVLQEHEVAPSILRGLVDNTLKRVVASANIDGTGGRLGGERIAALHDDVAWDAHVGESLANSSPADDDRRRDRGHDADGGTTGGRSAGDRRLHDEESRVGNRGSGGHVTVRS